MKQENVKQTVVAQCYQIK